MPVDTAELSEFAAFVGRMSRRTAAEIEALYHYPWLSKKPNYGYMLCVDGKVRGAIGAIYAERTVRGIPRRFCNLADWYVEPGFRGEAIALLLSVLGQRGYTFTSFTHIRPVARILESLRFRPVTEHAWLLHPLRDRAGRADIVLLDERNVDVLPAAEQRIFYDLRHARNTQHLLIRGADGRSYCMVQPIRRRHVRFALILYASAPVVVQGHLASLRRWARRTIGARFLISWGNLFAEPGAVAVRLRDPRRPLFRSRELTAGDIDALYSELTL